METPAFISESHNACYTAASLPSCQFHAFFLNMYPSFHLLMCCESRGTSRARESAPRVRQRKRQQMSPDPAQASCSHLPTAPPTPFGHVSLRSISDMQCRAEREGSGSWPRSLGGNVCAWEALGGAACSLKSHAGALNKSALDCLKVCRNLFVTRGACNKGVWEWKAGQHQPCIAMDINSVNQGICGDCRDSQMVLEY